MQQRGRKTFIGFLAIALAYIIVTGIVVHLSGGKANEEERAENAEFVSSSKYWLDRQLCRWIGVCGTMHMFFTSKWVWPESSENTTLVRGRNGRDFWIADQSVRPKKLRDIPQYVLDHAPYVHLFSGEEFWPGDLQEHLDHTMPYVNYTKILGLDHDYTVGDVDELNNYGNGEYGRYIYLASKDNVEEWPAWLGGRWNIPVRPHMANNEEMPIPSLEDLKDFDLSHAKQQALAASEEARQSFTSTAFPYEDLVVSMDGRCGGNTGFTCLGSRFGSCCSIYGWCGKSVEYCGTSCDPVSGYCPADPLHPSEPHLDLRRRDLSGYQNEDKRPAPGGRSAAPAFLIVVEKENGIVDAFWFFFYSFNLGQKVFNIRFGNHVGDWEHTTIRFVNGTPTEIFLSEHDFGEAYAWSAIEKYIPADDSLGTMIGSWTNATAARRATRPVIYSATGSHAMYGTPGYHPYVLPWGILHDQTDRGPLWDPVQNVHAYNYDLHEHTLHPSTLSPDAPTAWFDYAGHWGDKYQSLADPRQYRLAGQYHYVNGPLGPRFKNLARKSVCQGNGNCVVRDWIGDPTIPLGTPPEEDVEDGTLPGGNVTDDVW